MIPTVHGMDPLFLGSLKNDLKAKDPHKKRVTKDKGHHSTAGCPAFENNHEIVTCEPTILLSECDPATTRNHEGNVHPEDP